MSFLDAVGIPHQLRELARKLNLDEARLLVDWDRHTEVLISGGLTQTKAKLQAYDKVVADAYKRASYMRRS